jgi:hypothetical protein
VRELWKRPGRLHAIPPPHHVVQDDLQGGRSLSRFGRERVELVQQFGCVSLEVAPNWTWRVDSQQLHDVRVIPPAG